MSPDTQEFYVNENLTKIIDDFIIVKNKLEEVSRKSSELEKNLENDQAWSGKAKNTALELLQLIEKYQNLVQEVSNQQLKALISLNEKANSFMSSNSIVSKWRDMA